jgi:serine palmitoyltransferase
MTNALGAAGGFCAGSAQVVTHQRLAGQAYTFSASLPAPLAVTAIESLKLLKQNHTHLLSKLKETISTFHASMKSLDPRVKLSSSHPDSPLSHLYLCQMLPNREDEECILQDIVDLVSFFL